MLQKVREVIIDDLINFDVFDNKYYVVYRGTNIIDVYVIESYLYLDYKMRLPLYKQYENNVFRYNQLYNQFFKGVVRYYNQDFISFLIQDLDKNTTYLMMYSLATNQHNSFVFAENVTDQYPVSDSNIGLEYTRLFLTGDWWGKTKLVAISYQQIQVYDIKYFNRLTINIENLFSLISQCKYLTKREDLPSIENVTVKAISLFDENK